MYCLVLTFLALELLVDSMSCLIERVLPWKSRCTCHFEWWFSVHRASLIAQLVKNLPAMRETPVQFLQQQDLLEKGWATHFSILGLSLWLSWLRICLQCRRPGLDPWVGKIPWRRERLPTPVFWPREFHGLYRPWCCKVLNTTEWL